MSDCPNSDGFANCLESFDPTRFEIIRALALYSAAITTAHETYQSEAIRICLDRGADSRQLYEVMLQSYLFLGFPRMLQAADRLNREVPSLPGRDRSINEEDADPAIWLGRGRRLCKKVYDGNYTALKDRVEKMSPEIFHWMEMEGYGKVLSRPGLDIVDREMAIVACLQVENRTKQLHSHLRGALNVGAPPELLSDVVADLASAAPVGHTAALEILQRLGVN